MGGEGQEHDCALGSNLNQSRTAAVDPELPFKVAPVDGRYARESGPWQKARDAQPFINGRRKARSTEATLDLFVCRRADRAAGHVATTGRLSRQAM
jgi:hypothetical protein